MSEGDARRLILLLAVLLCLFFLTSCAPGPYLVYFPVDSSFALVPESFLPPSDTSAAPLPIPQDWEVVDADFADVTGDGAAEWILVVRRPWRDWPIMAWHGGTSPIAEFRDREGTSSHLIVMTPDGREIWAGSALPRPMRAIAAGDIDADGAAEVVTLEGEYREGPSRPARFIDVWKWDVFGFVLVHRSEEGSFRELGLCDTDNDGIVNIIIR
jgi:hypothetical protein